MAPKKTNSMGTCAMCRKEFGRAAMTRHVASCLPGKPGHQMGYHLLVVGEEMMEHWMHLLARRSAALGDLDAFLRMAWLECCGHMSSFRIRHTRHSLVPSEWAHEREMDFSSELHEVLTPGLKFSHAYDYGSTTRLALKVIAERPCPAAGPPIRLLALNNPPAYACGSCGKPAALIDTMADPEDALYCKRCAKRACDPEMVLPLVNSPRAGVCGYTGPAIQI